VFGFVCSDLIWGTIIISSVTNEDLEGFQIYLALWAYWLISDLIPKKYEKFEFSKNFVIMFLSSQNGPRKRNFNIFCPRIFDKLQKEIQNFTVGYLPLKMEILENFFSYRNQRKILIRGTFRL